MSTVSPIQLKRLDDHEDAGGAWEHLKGYGNLAFDIGANIGQAAKVLAVGYKTVIAFEPCQESFVALNAECPFNVIRRNIAISDHIGSVELDEMSYSISTGQLTTGSGLSWGVPVGKRKVSCTTLNQIAGLYGQPDFIKIDTEGHEVNIVIGGLDTLNKTQRFIIEVHAAENELPIRMMLPDRKFFKLSEPFYVSPEIRANHFWLQSTLYD